jgi:Leucine-rich repeat (LRR) protein
MNLFYSGQNRISELPEEIGLLENLEFLSVSYNFLTALPDAISNLSALREIRLSRNRFAQFPTQLLVGLNSLDLIDLSMNSLTTLADSNFSVMQVLDLNLDENFIQLLSPTLSSAPRLRILRLQNNLLSLDAIPECLLSDSMVKGTQ